jgi:ATP-dependent helicase/nuclease subunit A
MGHALASGLDRLAPRAGAPRVLTIAVTQLADFALCPRRYHLFHEVGHAETGTLDPLRRGTLAHRLLEHADLAAGGADVDGLLDAEGYDTADPEVARVRDRVRAFLATPFVRGLVARRVEVRRELPFLVALPVGPAGGDLTLRLRGQIDLLLVEDGEATVVDYKLERDAGGDDYRLQLDAYCLAASLLHPDLRRVRAGLAFLRERDPSPGLADFDEAQATRFRAQLADLGPALASARARLPVDGQWEGRPVETCRAIRCGYLYRCHPPRGEAEPG